MVFFASRKLGNFFSGVRLKALHLGAQRRPADICQPIKPYRTT